MLKLYKNIDGVTHYWETWDKNDNTGIVHWGALGTRGQHKEVKSGLFKNFRKIIQQEITAVTQDGYQMIDEDNLVTLMIEYTIDGFRTEQDLDKRHRLENLMDELLGWTGLGHSDGGSIGSGTMEVCCLVVDFGTAKKAIEEELANTEFADYSRIYDENND